MVINTVENKRMKMAMLNSRQIFMLQRYRNYRVSFSISVIIYNRYFKYYMHINSQNAFRNKNN